MQNKIARKSITKNAFYTNIIHNYNSTKNRTKNIIKYMKKY